MLFRYSLGLLVSATSVFAARKRLIMDTDLYSDVE